MGLDTSKKINRVTVNGSDMIVVGTPSLQDKTITENGVYTYDEPYDGLKQVEVDVQPPLVVKEITENGTYNASDDNAYGYSQVIVATKGAGGLDINGNLKQCEAGETLEAGDFVKTQGNVDVTANTIQCTSSDIPAIENLSPNKFLVFGQTGSKGIILNIENNFTQTKLAEKSGLATTSDPRGLHVSIKYDDTKYLVFCCSGYTTTQYVWGAVVEVVDNTITVLKRTRLSSSGYTWSVGLSGVTKGVARISDNLFVLSATSTTDQGLTPILFSVNPDDYSLIIPEDISMGSTTSKYCSNLMPISEKEIIWSTGSTWSKISPQVLKLRDIELATTTEIGSLGNFNTYSVTPKMVKINDDNVAILYVRGNTSASYYENCQTQCVIYNISSGTLSSEVQVSDKGLFSIPVKVEENKVQFMSVLGASDVRLTTVTFNGSQFVESKHKYYSIAPNKFYSFSSSRLYEIVFREIEALNSVLIYAYMDNSKYCKVLLGKPVATKITSSADTINGVTSQSGNTGDTVDVFVPNV